MIHALVAIRAYGETEAQDVDRAVARSADTSSSPEEKLFELVPCERCAVAIPPKHVPKQSGERGNKCLAAMQGRK